MKHVAFGFLLILFASCAKETVCHFTYQRLGASLATIGYSRDEIDTVYVQVFEANTRFSNRIRIDTIDTRSLTAKQDTLLFYEISSGEDYILSFPATGRQYEITEVYDPNKDETWTTKHGCPQGRSGVSMPNQAVINGDQKSGNRIGETPLPFSQYCFYLEK